jgi:hypothetical protein
MECEACIMSVSFGNSKNDVNALKKDNQRAIIKQVKNWIISWVNYCKNEAGYIKSFALFISFMNRPAVKEQPGECHTYIMDTYYIEKNWMQKN